jgi:hypothetical protein
MSSELRDRIREVEERLRQAMLKSDIGVLDELIADELLFTSQFGQLVSKEEDLAVFKSGILYLKELIPSEQHIQLHERFAVVSVLMRLLGSYANTSIDEVIRYTRVWVIAPDGSIQLMAGHASILQADSPTS